MSIERFSRVVTVGACQVTVRLSALCDSAGGPRFEVVWPTRPERLPPDLMRQFDLERNRAIREIRVELERD